MRVTANISRTVVNFNGRPALNPADSGWENRATHIVRYNGKNLVHTSKRYKLTRLLVCPVKTANPSLTRVSLENCRVNIANPGSIRVSLEKCSVNITQASLNLSHFKSLGIDLSCDSFFCIQACDFERALKTFRFILGVKFSKIFECMHNQSLVEAGTLLNLLAY